MKTSHSLSPSTSELKILCPTEMNIRETVTLFLFTLLSSPLLECNTGHFSEIIVRKETGSKTDFRTGIGIGTGNRVFTWSRHLYCTNEGYGLPPSNDFGGASYNAPPVPSPSPHPTRTDQSPPQWSKPPSSSTLVKNSISKRTGQSLQPQLEA